MYVKRHYCVRFAIGIFSAAVFLFSGVFGVHGATADELKQQIEARNQEIAKIQAELKEYNDQLSKTSQVSKTLKTTIDSLNKNIKLLKSQITLTEKQIQRKQLEIQQLGISIVQKEIDIEEKKNAIGDMVQELAMRQQRGLLEVFFSDISMSDFFTYIEENQNIQVSLQNTLSEYKNLRDQLASQKNEAEQKKNELNRYEHSLADKKVITEQQKNESQNLLAVTKNQEKAYQVLLADREQKYQEVQRQLEQLEEELRKKVDISSLPSRRQGFLAWPVQGRVTQGYGATPFSRYSDFYTFHNGIDIAGPVGTEIDVAESGTVLAVGNSDLYCPRGAYGKYVVIDHANNLVTLYTHMSLQKVSVGERVFRGQLIGYVGTTGLTTGPHLHFTVYDKRTFELRQSKICGILPYGGSVNPLDYL